MTVAPELPPASVDRRAADTGAVPLARAGRRRSAAAHATGAVVVRSAPRPIPAPGRPTDPATGWAAAPGGPVRRMPARTDLVPAPARPAPHRAVPGVTDWRPDPAAEPVTRPLGPDARPGAGTTGVHPPVGPRPRRPPRRRGGRPARPPLRLTVRGKLLLGLLGGLAALTAMLVVTARVDAVREPASPVPASAPATVVVEPGETLWSIAGRVAPDRDPRVVVDQLRRINGLPSGDVRAGQRILLRTP